MTRMRDGTDTSEVWIQGALAAPVLVLIVAAIASSFFRELGPDDVKIAASDLRSASSTTRQLLEQYQRGELTKRYYAAHIHLLEDEVSAQYNALNTASVDDTIRNEQAETRDLAARLDDVLKRLDDETADLDSSRMDALQMTRKFATIEERLRMKVQSQ
jgi:hypothetical protein